ncbi:MAG: C2H2-type zinc finger protein [Terriglobales bacterium]
MGRKFKCRLCSRTFKTAQALRIHRQSAHPPPVGRRKSNQPR